jgi:glucosamine 6-phosphate synthetase-like amidotransferase/phosphosugar isomerase protein
VEKMSFADVELATQPEMWRKVAKLAPDYWHLLPKKGERVAVVGCGTSWYMAMAYASLRESRGQGETDSYTAAEFNYSRNYDRVVFISRSGTTTEVIEVLEKIKSPSLVITGVKDSPVVNLANESIILDFADEQSVVQTRFATSTLGLLRTTVGTDLSSVADEAEIALASDLGTLPTSEQITFLGKGWTIALAQEAALKARETARFWTEAYPALDYRHGPLSIAQKGRTVWVFGEIEDSLQRDIKATGAYLEMSKLDPMAHLVRAQRTALAIAKSRNMDPDFPRALGRSVILK